MLELLQTKKLKIKNYSILILSILSFQSYAQNESINYGIKAGVNYSKLTESLINYETTPKFGFQIGGIIELPIFKKVMLQSELFYSEIGSKSNVGVYQIDPNSARPGPFIFRFTDISLKYINLPILGKYYIIDQLSIQVGPQIRYLLSGKLIYKQSILDNVNEELRTVSLTNYEKFDISIKVGISYKHKTGIFLNLNYDHGLTNLIKSNIIIPQGQVTQLWIGDNENLKNRGLFMSVGYFFN